MGGHTNLHLEVGLKTDPVEYRYSYPWLFRLAAEEGIRHLQLGSFFEIYQLPDEYFRELRRRADDAGVAITSLFTAHRELGGFFRDDGPGWVAVARRNLERFIQIAALLGAKSVGANPGAVLRDRMGTKERGLKTYLGHFKEAMHQAGDLGIEWLTIEPMSCLAEPPTLPQEIQAMGGELEAYHAAHPGTCRAGMCVDVAHGYADAQGRTVHDHVELLEAALPWCCELHLKNTDDQFHSTFGFSDRERARGIVKVPEIVAALSRHADCLPTKHLIGYLEIGGPKVGRDYSDGQLEAMIRESLRYPKQAYVMPDEPVPAAPPVLSIGAVQLPGASMPGVQIAPSIMCADQCHLEESIRGLESAGADLLHFDLMDTHFTPNMPLGLVTLEQLRPLTHLPYDAHLMVTNPDFFIRELARIGVQYCSVHAEACPHLDRTLTLLRDSGMKAGVALNPATPLNVLEYVLDRLDFVLIMTVNPGFAGQKLVPAGLRKIADCRAYLDRQRAAQRIPIEVDGNVSFEHIPAMVAAGADMLVAGTSSIFHSGGSLQANTTRLRDAITQGLARRQR